MGRPQDSPNVNPPTPTHAAQAPPQYPQEEATPQYPPASSPYAAEPRSPYSFPPHQPTQHPQTASFHPHPPPPPQPCQAPFQATPFPPEQRPHVQPSPPPRPAVLYPPGPQHPPSPQPPPLPGVPYPKPPPLYGQWTTGLFDCLDDPNNALITLCFPCVTFGQVAEILDNGQTTCATSAMMYGAIALLLGVPCILSCNYRTKLRAKYGLMESPAPDWMTHCFFDWCAICQEYRELRNRGIDPGIGWYANMMLQAQQQQMTMAPPANQTMSA